MFLNPSAPQTGGATQLPREDYIRDITYIKLGLNDPTKSGHKAMNTIVDCLMQGAFEGFEKSLNTTFNADKIKQCRLTTGAKLVDKLVQTYLAKAYPAFARALKDFSVEELKVIDDTLHEGREGKTTVMFPDWENLTNARFPTIIYDTQTHKKFDIATSNAQTKEEIGVIQNEVIQSAKALLSESVLNEMHVILCNEEAARDPVALAEPSPQAAEAVAPLVPPPPGSAPAPKPSEQVD